MTTVKIAVSLPRELVDDAKRAVRRKAAKSVSAYVADALREKSKRSERYDLKVLLDEMLAETGGPLTQAEIDWADQALGHKTLKKKKKKKSRRST
jgi:Arc/MetJ-type ribon-helix-helix transcriptional regulator